MVVASRTAAARIATASSRRRRQSRGAGGTGPRGGTRESPGYSHSMATTDEAVLRYIGLRGRSHEEVAERFPGFDMVRLIRAHLVTVISDDRADTEAHVLDAFAVRYALTPRGIAAIGVADFAPDF